MGVVFDVHGHDHPGDPVLLSSGLGGAAGYWKQQLPALLDAGYKVICYDQAGTGRSGAALPSAYSIAHMAQDVLEILDASGSQRCHLLGHALGGLVGLQLAIQAPQRLASLGLINSWATLSQHTARCFAARLALLDACGAQAYVQAQPIFLYPADWCEQHAELVDAEVAHALAHFPGAQNMHARIQALRSFDASPALASLSLPVWVVASEDDCLVPVGCSQALARGLPTATLSLFAHGGHAINITEPARFNAQFLEFLTTCKGG